MVNHVKPLSGAGSDNKLHIVPSLTFDQLLTSDELANTRFLKVDVEGHEASLRAHSSLRSLRAHSSLTR